MPRIRGLIKCGVSTCSQIVTTTITKTICRTTRATVLRGRSIGTISSTGCGWSVQHCSPLYTWNMYFAPQSTDASLYETAWRRQCGWHLLAMVWHVLFSFIPVQLSSIRWPSWLRWVGKIHIPVLEPHRLAPSVISLTENHKVSCLCTRLQTDLVSTIGESVALGAAGIIFWGDTSYASNSVSIIDLGSLGLSGLVLNGFYFLLSPQASCSRLNDYLRGPLGQYLLNVSTAAEQCSEIMCKTHGRCLRKTQDSDVYLHLSPSTHSITGLDGRLKVTGTPGQAERNLFRTHFQCQCYSGYSGEACDQREKGKNRAASFLGPWPLLVLLPLGLLFLMQWVIWVVRMLLYFCKILNCSLTLVLTSLYIIINHFQEESVLLPDIFEFKRWLHHCT